MEECGHERHDGFFCELPPGHGGRHSADGVGEWDDRDSLRGQRDRALALLRVLGAHDMTDPCPSCGGIYPCADDCELAAILRDMDA